MSTFEYRVEAWEPEDFRPPDEVSCPEAVFLIEIYTQSSWNKFSVPRDHLLRDNTAWSTISTLLSLINVPLDAQAAMITKIISCARSIVHRDDNLNRKIIPMVVTLCVESVNSLISMPSCAVLALEKVEVEGSSEQCVICLEEMLVGSEAARTPCLHVYHEDCITNWLKKSMACPLCRSQM